MWRQSCDTMECYQILTVLTEFYYERMSKEEAKGHLTKLLTEDMKPYHDAAAPLIEKIMYEEPKTEVTKEESVVKKETAQKEVVTKSGWRSIK